MLKNLVLTAILVTSGCGSVQEHISSPALSMNTGNSANTMKKSVTDNCEKSNLRERLRSFYSHVPSKFRDVEKDTQLINELRQCPRETVINSLSELRDSNKNDFEIKAKTSYLLIKLNPNDKDSQNQLLKAFSTFPKGGNSHYTSDYVIGMIADIIINDDPGGAVLTEAFDLETNGATATMLVGTFASVFEKNPERFLQLLKEKPKTIRESTYVDMCFMSTPAKLTETLLTIAPDSESYPASKEMSQFIENSKACQ